MCAILSACAGATPFQVMQGLLGYTPPPEKTTVSEELQLEYDRCVKIGVERNCAQAAFDIVRRVKGMEPRVVPEGVVIILEGDGGYGDEEEQEKPPESKDREDNP